MTQPDRFMPDPLSPEETLGSSSWNSLVTGMEAHGLTATALTNTAQLQEEGKRMLHAVGAWSQYCTRGISRVFRIERDGEPVATGEITPRKGGEWGLRQVRGPRNTNPLPEARLIMEEVAREYTRLQAEQKGDEEEQRLWKQDRLSSVHSAPDEE